VRKVTVGLLSLALATGLGVGFSPSSAVAQQGSGKAATVSKKSAVAVADELRNPQEDKRRALREQGLNMVLHGKGKVVKRGASRVIKVGQSSTAGRQLKAKAQTDQYVELSREKTDKIFVILAEFGNQRDPAYPDVDTDPDTPGPVTWDGPLHNAIPQPGPDDNSTNWQPDFNRAHFQNLYFGTGKNVDSVKTFYEKQSSGRYSVDGTVSDWVKVPYNEARYGRDLCGSNICSNAYDLVRDAANQWVADQKAKGRTTEQIRADLASYDKWDRYDHDGDGNFNEPDGYIDHFQIVHAGGDQADGDPQQGEDAIWSHRGVFAHEYGHDLGLPDNYDTLGGDNGVEWWDLMAQDRLNAAGDAIGTKPAEMSAWDKIQLGWFDYEIVKAGQQRTLNLGPHEYNSKKAQGVVVVLPKKNVTTTFVPPTSGTHTWWSGKGNDLENTLSRSVTLPAGSPASLDLQANWDIEDCGPDPCDYAYVEVDDGSGYKPIPGTITNPDEGNGIDGASNGWKAGHFDLSSYAGKTIGLRFRYSTDGAAGGLGFFADDIKVTSGSQTLVDDGAENGANGWTADGFEAVGTSKTVAYDNYYIASHRSYVSYDKYLTTGPYNFGFLNTKPDFVEHFSYEKGLLVSYWDTSQADNNTSAHPGEGLILPIDAHPRAIYRLDGLPWRSRVQIYDAPFSQEKADSFTLHVNGSPSYIRGQNAQPTFDDSRSYWSPDIPMTGVKVPDAGVRIKVADTNGTSMKIKISST
jgi:immune inhibitor A